MPCQPRAFHYPLRFISHVIYSMHQHRFCVNVLDHVSTSKWGVYGCWCSWASPRGGGMWNHQYFQATNQWLATNVSHDKHLYQDGSGNLESYISGSDQAGCCTGTAATIQSYT